MRVEICRILAQRRDLFYFTCKRLSKIVYKQRKGNQLGESQDKMAYKLTDNSTQKKDFSLANTSFLKDCFKCLKIGFSQEV